MKNVYLFYLSLLCSLLCSSQATAQIKNTTEVQLQAPEELIDLINSSKDDKNHKNDETLEIKESKPAQKFTKLPLKSKARLLILDLKNKGIDQKVFESLNLAMIKQAQDSFPGESLSQEQIRMSIEASETQLALGCESEECMIDLGRKVEADLLLGGSISKVGNDLLIQISLLEPGIAKSISNVQRKVPTIKDLSYYAIRQMTSKALTGESFDPRVPLYIDANQSFVTVFVDGRIIGSTPLTVNLDPGSHQIRIQLDDFIPWKATINVEEGRAQKIFAELSPRGFPLWPTATFLTGTGVFLAASWLALAAYTLESYDGSIGIYQSLGFVDAKSDYQHIAPATTALLSEKKAQLILLSYLTDAVGIGALFFGGLGISVFAADVYLRSNEE